jgi:hypothetical protein
MATPTTQQQGAQNPIPQEKQKHWPGIVAVVITTLGLIVVAVIGLVQDWWGPGETGTKDRVSIEITNDDDLTPEITGPVTLKGSVKNLGPGQTVWAFDLPAGSSGVWAHDGPCPVDAEGNWTCPVFDLGDLDGADNGKVFKIFAAVLDDSDIPKQIDLRLERYKDIYNPMNSPVPPGVAADYVETKKK